MKAFLPLVVSCVMGVVPAMAGSKSAALLHVFGELPADGLLQTPCLPTPNTALTADDTEGFAARTRTNETYGMPGWTRGQGGHFHKGVDILPVHFEKTDDTVRIEYYDPKTGRDFAKNETVLVPKDEIYTILDGKVVMANRDESRSGYGRYIMVEHHFADGSPFISMYAHLDRLEVGEGDTVQRGQRIGWMGRTSSNSGGRSYLKAIPHCHFEVGRVINNDFGGTAEAKSLYPRVLGGKYDPRNIQPYQPVKFLRGYHAQTGTMVTVSRATPGLRAN